MQTAILIYGPTASGKTELSLDLAERLNGEVVNADSMQVYRDLKVVSARPGQDETGDIPHHLFGHLPASERYSTGRWLRDASQIIEDIWKRGKLPIVTGGTGLYHLALVEGLSEIPPIPDEVRHDVASWLRDRGVEGLYAQLKQRDADAAAILNPSDRQRIARALEVFTATGQSITSFRGNVSPPS
jgi:tRNA dimethylallyltransferase